MKKPNMAASKSYAREILSFLVRYRICDCVSPISTATGVRTNVYFDIDK